ncbi:MAG: hypothetical protein AAF333_13440 [Planctomycetota bacterium]
MPIVINSPYSGLPVKIRDQDIGRAVRDEEGRVFYVVPRASGEGYYSAPTRKGSAKDEARYDKMETRVAQVQEMVDAQAQTVHDATGKRRANPVGRLIVLVLLLGVLTVGGYTAYLMWGGGTAPEWWPLPVPESVPFLDPSGPSDPDASATHTEPKLFRPGVL